MDTKQICYTAIAVTFLVGTIAFSIAATFHTNSDRAACAVLAAVSLAASIVFLARARL